MLIFLLGYLVCGGGGRLFWTVTGCQLESRLTGLTREDRDKRNEQIVNLLREHLSFVYWWTRLEVGRGDGGKVDIRYYSRVTSHQIQRN